MTKLVLVPLEFRSALISAALYLDQVRGLFQSLLPRYPAPGFRLAGRAAAGSRKRRSGFPARHTAAMLDACRDEATGLCQIPGVADPEPQ